MLIRLIFFVCIRNPARSQLKLGLMVNLGNSPFFKGGKGDLNQNFSWILLLTCNIPNSRID
jgi:hypothetical protein